MPPLVNYYERHIGDYTRDTAHLSLLEHGIYSRFLDLYYTREKPLPADPKAIERLVGARSRDEREAVRAVLEEFFELATDGWNNKRCNEELARFEDKRAKAKRSADARWNAQPTHSGRNANASRTHDERNALQTPDSSHQTPVTSSGGGEDARARSNGQSHANAPTETTASTEPQPGADAWRDAGCDPEAMATWLAHRQASGKPLPPHACIHAAQVLRGMGDADTQRRAVQTAVANNWQSLRIGDGSQPSAGKGGKSFEERMAPLYAAAGDEDAA